MYNGIGLTTARGSGTNGHVQRNWALIKLHKDQVNYRTEEEIAKLDAAANKQPNQGILDHERKRKMEVKCAEFEELLEAQGIPAADIKAKVDSFRSKLIEELHPEVPKDHFGRVIARDTHQVAEAQQVKNAKLRDAFGISEYFVEGSSFDPARRAKEELAKSAAIQEREQSRKNYALVRTPSPEKEKEKKKRKIRESSSSPEPKKDKKKKSKKHKRDRSVSKAKKAKDKKKKKKRDQSSSSESANSSDSESNSESEREKKKRKKNKKKKRASRKKHQSESDTSRDSSPHVEKKDAKTKTDVHDKTENHSKNETSRLEKASSSTNSNKVEQRHSRVDKVDDRARGNDDRRAVNVSRDRFDRRNRDRDRYEGNRDRDRDRHREWERDRINKNRRYDREQRRSPSRRRSRSPRNRPRRSVSNERKTRRSVSNERKNKRSISNDRRRRSISRDRRSRDRRHVSVDRNRRHASVDRECNTKISNRSQSPKDKPHSRRRSRSLTPQGDKNKKDTRCTSRSVSRSPRNRRDYRKSLTPKRKDKSTFRRELHSPVRKETKSDSSPKRQKDYRRKSSSPHKSVSPKRKVISRKSRTPSPKKPSSNYSKSPKRRSRSHSLPKGKRHQEDSPSPVKSQKLQLEIDRKIDTIDHRPKKIEIQLAPEEKSKKRINSPVEVKIIKQKKEKSRPSRSESSNSSSESSDNSSTEMLSFSPAARNPEKYRDIIEKYPKKPEKTPPRPRRWDREEPIPTTKKNISHESSTTPPKEIEPKSRAKRSRSPSQSKNKRPTYPQQPIVRLRSSDDESSEHDNDPVKVDDDREKELRMLKMLKSGLAAKAKETIEKKRSSLENKSDNDADKINSNDIINKLGLNDKYKKCDTASAEVTPEKFLAIMKEAYRPRNKSPKCSLTSLTEKIIAPLPEMQVPISMQVASPDRKKSRKSRSSSRSTSGSHRRYSSSSSDSHSSRSSNSSSGSSRSSSDSSRSRSSHSSKSRSQSKSRSRSKSNSRSRSRSHSRSRSPSIPRRHGSPSFLDRRRITSARKRPIPYHRQTPSSGSSVSSWSSCPSSPLSPWSRNSRSRSKTRSRSRIRTPSYN